jgi:1-acyl-sn-glycerol-3-phosphate acyltransferase
VADAVEVGDASGRAAAPSLRAIFGAALALLLTILFLIPGNLLVALGLGRPALRLAPIWARLCLVCLGVKLEVVGREHLPPAGNGYIAAASHCSALDIPIYTSLLPHTLRYVAKRELSRLPLFGWAFGRTGNLYVDRGGTPETRDRFNLALRREPSRPILIYPEGTRTRNGEIQNFKHGFVYMALASGLPILPMVSRGAFELWPKGQRLSRAGRVTVIIGPLIETEGWREETIAEHAEAVRGVMRGLEDSPILNRLRGILPSDVNEDDHRKHLEEKHR